VSVARDFAGGASGVEGSVLSGQGRGFEDHDAGRSSNIAYVDGDSGLPRILSALTAISRDVKIRPEAVSKIADGLPDSVEYPRNLHRTA
jgi:hypothetical protein